MRTLPSTLLLAAVLGAAAAPAPAAPWDLPPLDRALNYQPKQPLQVFTADGVEIAQFGTAYLVPSEHDWLGDGFYTDLKLYADATYTRLSDGSDGVRPGRARDDVVLLFGARFSFY